MRYLIPLFLLILTIAGGLQANAQAFKLEFSILNPPDNFILLEAVSGDNVVVLDSALAKNGTVRFELPETAHAGVYRLVFGKTGYAKVMNLDPQTLDFIFNHEVINLKTDFKQPLETANVIKSDENKVYFDFLIRKKEFENVLKMMELELDVFWAKGDSAKAITAADEYNRIQMDWDLRTVQTAEQNNLLFAAKLIALQRTPLKDGFLSTDERNLTYRSEFLQNVNFNDEELIQSAGYTDKLFEYLKLFNQPGLTQSQRSKAYIKAVDMVFDKSVKNESVDKFIKSYLLHGFQVLGMKEVIDHIKAKH